MFKTLFAIMLALLMGFAQPGARKAVKNPLRIQQIIGGDPCPPPPPPPPEGGSSGGGAGGGGGGGW